MKLLVTGINGQLGHDVVDEATKLGFDVVGVDREILDLTDGQAIQNFFENKHFDAIVHCAAYTAVDAAEDDVQTAEAVNATASKYLVEAARQMQAKFMNISTDYVYDGSGNQPFTETDTTNPLNVYGVTKKAGEQFALTYEKTFVVRVSWVFGINGNNFVKTMLRLGEERDTLQVVADQYGSPTYTRDLSKLLMEMIQSDAYGIYNASNEGFCSWYEFVCEIFRQQQMNVKVIPLKTSEYPTRAKRPANSRMCKDKLVANGFKKLPPWQDALTRYLEELREVK